MSEHELPLSLCGLAEGETDAQLSGRDLGIDDRLLIKWDVTKGAANRSLTRLDVSNNPSIGEYEHDKEEMIKLVELYARMQFAKLREHMGERDDDSPKAMAKMLLEAMKVAGVRQVDSFAEEFEEQLVALLFNPGGWRCGGVSVCVSVWVGGRVRGWVGARVFVSCV